jgi:hypothetical protein
VRENNWRHGLPSPAVPPLEETQAWRSLAKVSSFAL